MYRIRSVLSLMGPVALANCTLFAAGKSWDCSPAVPPLLALDWLEANKHATTAIAQNSILVVDIFFPWVRCDPRTLEHQQDDVRRMTEDNHRRLRVFG